MSDVGADMIIHQTLTDRMTLAHTSYSRDYALDILVYIFLAMVNNAEVHTAL